jgi:hypothetical protein
MRPIGLNELRFDDRGDIVVEHVDYRIIERGGKKFAEPVGIGRGHVGIGDGFISIDGYFPLEDIPCDECGVYGLVHTLNIGKYVCANCGAILTISPSTKLHIK